MADTEPGLQTCCLYPFTFHLSPFTFHLSPVISFKRIVQFLTHDIWQSQRTQNSKWRKFANNSIRSIVLTVRGFLENDISTRANAMTYSMTFALVPILALDLAIAKGFGFEQLIADKLNESFLGSMGLVPTIMGFVERYLETTQGGAVLGVGLLVLLWSVYSFFRNIESSFNAIWQVKQSRSVFRQFATYIAILLLVPILIVVSSGLSVFLSSALSELPLFATMAPVRGFLIRLMPFVVCWLIFTWMYWAIPNTHVGGWACIIPGVMMGTLFQLLQMLTVYLVVFLSRTSIIYGAFAAIPLLLTWIQLSCLFILSGAELSFAIENNEDFDYHSELKHISRRYKDYVTLYITWLVVKRFENMQEPQSAREMAQENNLPTRLINQLLGRLVEVKVLREVHVEGREEKTFMPAMDISKMTVGHVFNAIDQQGSELFIKNPSEQAGRFWERFVELRQQETDITQVLIKDIVV